MTELVKYIACSLVDHPEQVEVVEVQGEQALILDVERAKYWVGVGAQPTQTVKTVLRKGGAID